MKLLRPLLPLLIGAGALEAQTPTVLLFEGDPVPGIPGSSITALQGVELNGIGGWMAGMLYEQGGAIQECGLASVDGQPPYSLLQEATHGNLEQTELALKSVDDLGRHLYTATSFEVPNGSNAIYGLWRDDAPLALRGEPAAGIPGQTYQVFHAFGQYAGDQVHFEAGYTTPPFGVFPAGQALFAGDPLQVLYKSGDQLPFVNGTLIQNAQTTSAILSTHFARQGTHHLVGVQVGNTTNPRSYAILDGTPVFADGVVVGENISLGPNLEIHPNEHWDGVDARGVTESGSTLVWGLTNFRSVLLHDGFLAMFEDQVLGDWTLRSNNEGAAMNEGRDIVAQWNATLAGSNDWIETLFFNGRPLVQEGDRVDLDGDGVVDPGYEVREFWLNRARIDDERRVYAFAVLREEPPGVNNNIQAQLFVDVPDLALDANELSVSAGGASTMTLFAPRDVGAEFYFLLASMSGTSPGLLLDGQVLPLNPDPLFQLALDQANGSVFQQSFGSLDALHTAEAAFVLPAGVSGALVGQTIDFAYLTLGTQPALQVRSTSAPASLLLTP